MFAGKNINLTSLQMLQSGYLSICWSFLLENPAIPEKMTLKRVKVKPTGYRSSYPSIKGSLQAYIVAVPKAFVFEWCPVNEFTPSILTPQWSLNDSGEAQ